MAPIDQYSQTGDGRTDGIIQGWRHFTSCVCVFCKLRTNELTPWPVRPFRLRSGTIGGSVLSVPELMRISSLDGGLRTLFRKNLPAWHWQSIESAMTGMGIPDSNFCYQGLEGWVEFKECQGMMVRISPMQIGWLMRRARSGGRCFVAVRHKGSDLYLYHGALAAGLAQPGGVMGTPRLGKWTGGPALWAWGEVGDVLLGKGEQP